MQSGICKQTVYSPIWCVNNARRVRCRPTKYDAVWRASTYQMSKHVTSPVVHATAAPPRTRTVRETSPKHRVHHFGIGGPLLHCSPPPTMSEDVMNGRLRKPVVSSQRFVDVFYNKNRILEINNNNYQPDVMPDHCSSPVKSQ